MERDQASKFITDLLRLMVSKKGSDLFITVGFPPGGNTLWTNDKCVITLWNNDAQNNVNWAEIYPNGISPNKSGIWLWGQGD